MSYTVYNITQYYTILYNTVLNMNSRRDITILQYYNSICYITHNIVHICYLYNTVYNIVHCVLFNIVHV